MTYETAHKILSAHQAWRRGLVDVMEYTAAEVSEALELAITALQSDPDALDWSQAPEWARWYAVDADGQTNWFEKKPEKIRSNWYASDGIHQTVINSMKLLKRPDL